MIERTKRRFETSTAPDGTPWKPNRPATQAMLAERLGGHKSKVKKDGSLNAAGLRQLVRSRRLIVAEIKGTPRNKRDTQE